MLIFQNLKIALISDELTRSCLHHECKVFNVTPWNYKIALKLWKPDLLFVESAWEGVGSAWKYKIAAYPDRPERTNVVLRKVIHYARDLSIPCVFWNKEDSVHFERFISSASFFDIIFTVDAGCIDRYHQQIEHSVTVAPLMFAAQPRIHSFSEPNDRVIRANFVGSYSRHLHDLRRDRQDMLFSAACSTIGLTVYDRNSNRKSQNYRYPDFSGIEIKKRVPHHKTAEIYNKYLISLNLNTVDDSETMVSRRLIEIVASGGLAITTPALSVEKHFKDYCYVVDSEDEAADVFASLKEGYRSKDIEMMRAGAAFISEHHSYTHRLKTVLETIERHRL